MKVAIVKLSTIREARPGNTLHMEDGSKRSLLRLDAGFWLGTDEDERVRRLERYLRNAIGRYKNALMAQRESRTRAACRLRDGEQQSPCK